MSTTLKSAETLLGTIRGQAIEPGDPDYEEARALYNAMIDKRPALIVRCSDAADVQAAVKFARQRGARARRARRRPQRRRPRQRRRRPRRSTSRR